ncbi:hypothetical protein KIPB_007814 [Kipferlia bialata]|uniref:J domain-containing protein n=1 Tax=Kipferlia bialata TaxID=797122 RepID=A0A9K3GJD5_9EUKA|nr:hypothetical protein KIPB_007814 [Kipferlia bialata]|eukprot:g7814.t1
MVLGVSEDADERTLKKAYYKLSLKWHPDRNHGNEEEAAETFKGIQAAYAVLADPQEKAFYDRHKADIMYGKATDLSTDTALNLWSYFRRDCYNEFNDQPDGFYTVYGKVFATLLAEEEVARAHDKDKQVKPLTLPVFGDSAEGTARVKAFYDRWLSFSTIKPFGHADKWDPRHYKDEGRRVRRLVDKENEKQRDKARANFDSEVRTFVRFVQKRDPRYAVYLNEQQLRKMERAEARERAKEERKAREAQEEVERQQQAEERKRLLQQRIEEVDLHAAQTGLMDADMIAEEWGQKPRGKGEMDERDREEEEGPGTEVEEYEPIPVDIQAQGCAWVDGVYHCCICGKSAKGMKTLGQFKSHAQSKKHRAKAKAVKSASVTVPTSVSPPATKAPVTAPEQEDSDDDWDTRKRGKGKKKGKKKGKGSAAVTPAPAPAPVVETEDSDDDWDTKRRGKGKKKGKKKGRGQAQMASAQVAATPATPAPEGGEGDDTPLVVGGEAPAVDTASPAPEGEGEEEVPVQGMSKKAKRRAKNKRKNELKCRVCGEVFPSKNKMFDHLKNSGHATAYFN